MAYLNTCILAGNLTRDPDLRYSPKGIAITSGAVAVNRSWKSESGGPREEVSFIEFRAFGRIAENICKFFKKGGNILFQGRLLQERWEDKQTSQPRSKVVLVAESFQFMNKNGGNDEKGKPAEQPDHDDIPF
jgi:single-strand DNA-binding protein